MGKDGMLINSGLESSCEAKSIDTSQPALKLLTGSPDGYGVFEAAVRELPKALEWLLGDGWNGGSSQRAVIPVCHLFLL